jgi:hypothetical protein
VRATSQQMPATENKKSGAQRTRIQWNHEVHRDWGKENLYFFRLFFRTYSRKRILPALREVLVQYDVRSYALYETMGFHDTLIKVWLPTVHSPGAFQKSLNERLNPTNADWFYVEALLRHWPWGENGPPRTPTKAALEARLSPDEIRRVNERKVSPVQLRKYIARNLVVKAQRTSGVKFVVLVTGFQTQNFGGSTMEQLQEKLCEIVDGAKSIRERSLYLGVGFGNTQFLILGRVPYPKFHAIGDEITDKINTEMMAGVFDARTHTYLSATRDLLDFKDGLVAGAVSTEAERRPVADYLTEDESETVEVKGSAFTDLAPWLRGEQRRQRDPSVTHKGVLKAMVAFLNSQGGTIVLGALEADKFPDNPKLEGCPRVGDYICCGVEWDYTKGGNWDRFQRQLHEAIKARLRPSSLTQWYTITRDDVKGKPLCLIHVRAPAQGWYYLDIPSETDPHFYVREGNRTIRLSGPEEDDYKNAHRRAPRSP